jgi:hypothetical protein
MIRILPERIYRIPLSPRFSTRSPSFLLRKARLDGGFIFSLYNRFEDVVGMNGLAEGNVCPDSYWNMDVFGFLPFPLSWQ